MKKWLNTEHVLDEETGCKVRVWMRRSDSHCKYKWRAGAADTLPSLQRRGRTPEEAFEHWKESYKKYVAGKVAKRMERS